jgi:predicted dehydrogenase
VGVERLRCSIVGLGRIGSLLEDDRLREKPCTHAGAVARSRDCVLAAGCDIDGGRRARFARRWNCGQVFESLERMLGEVPTDILHVATPPDSHREIVERALPFGVKVVICEKPLANERADAERIARIHRSGRVRILVNHERRYSLDYLRARALAASGTLGRLLSAAGRLSLGGGGDVFATFLEDGTHLVDAVRFLIGSGLEVAHAAVTGSRGARTLNVLARSSRGPKGRDEDGLGPVPVVLEIGAGRDHLVFEIDLGFESGRLRIGNGLYEEHRSGPSPYYEGMKSLAIRKARGPRVTGFFSRMLEDAVECARDEGRTPVSSAVDGLAAFLFVESAKRRAAASGR